MSTPWHLRCRLLASLLVVGLVQRFAPWALAQDISWFRLNGLPQVSTGVDVDGSWESDRVNGVNSIYDTLFITPTVGLQTSGYIYHPNLLSFDFDGELGWGIDRMTTTSPGFKQSINESDQLNRYLLEINLLEEKPYNASFFASEDHTYRDYGSFETFLVDSTRYGGRVNWNTENLSLNTDFGYRDETDTGLIDSSEVTETYFNFVGINKRHSGQTTVTARWDMFDNILNFGNELTTMNESVGISDSETFGRRQQITAATGVTLSHAEYGGQQLDTVQASENVNINHTRNLDSFFIFNAELDNLHPATETYIQGDYGIRHQLYESLTSTLDVHGSYQDNTDPSGSSTFDLYGVGLAESYLKRLQSWGRLSIGANIIADHQDDTTSGDTLTSIDEAHQLYLPTSPQYRPVYLNRPDVLGGSIQVTAAGQVLVLGSDYQVVNSGQLTEVRLISPPSSHLQMLLGANDNLSVSVSYQSASSTLSNASFEDLNSTVQIRLDLFNHLGIYGRLNWMDNNAPPSVLTETLTDLVGGVDYNWRWFRAGAEYEDYDSNYTQYNALRFFQNLDFQLNDRSTLGLNFNETFYDYPAGGDQTLYQFTTRYSVQLWSSLSCYVQGGCALQDVLGTDEIDASAQTGLNWSRGKLSVRTGYEYNSQSTSSGTFTEDLSRNRLFFYLKRAF
jgi:hypothetical protein